MISNNRGGTAYYKVNNINGKRNVCALYDDDIEQIYKLAHKEYLKEYNKAIEKDIALLEKIKAQFVSLDDYGILERLPKNYDKLKLQFVVNPELIEKEKRVPRPVGDGSVKPLALATNLRDMLASAFRNSWMDITKEEWAKMPYCENTSFLEFKNQMAYNGLKVRSKSEALILERYDEKNICYHYDEKLKIGERFVSPDIIFVKANGDLAIHEHAGVWTEEYSKRNAEKFAIYKQAGFVQGKNLILTFDDENGNINVRLIDELINDMYRR